MSEKKNGVSFWGRTIRFLGWAFVSIVLGGIGSVFANLFLQDFLTSLGTLVLQTIASVSSTYVDLLHQDIGEAKIDGLSIFSGMLLMILIIFFPWTAIYIMKAKIREESDVSEFDAKQFFRKFLIIFTLVGVFITIMYTHQLITLIYERNACLWIERSITILGAYLDDKQLKILRSDYALIQNSASFYELETRLRQLAVQNGVELPEFTVIGNNTVHPN